MKVINALLLTLLTIVTVFSEHNDIDNDHETEDTVLESLKHGSTQSDNGIIIKVYNKYRSSPLITLEDGLQFIASKIGT